jgi:hypothetical protein
LLPDCGSPLSKALSCPTTLRAPPSPVQLQVTVVSGETRIAGGANAKFPPLPDALTATSTDPEPVVSATLPP